MDEGQGVSIDPSAQGGVVHQVAYRKVGQHQAVELLSYELGCLASENNAASSEVGLELIEGRFDLPALVVERGQFFRRCGTHVQNGGDETVYLFGLVGAL